MSDFEAEAAPREPTLSERYGDAQRQTDSARERLQRARRDLAAAEGAFVEAYDREETLWNQLCDESVARSNANQKVVTS